MADPTPANLEPTVTVRETKCKFAFDKKLSYAFFLVTHFTVGDEMRDEVK